MDTLTHACFGLAVGWALAGSPAEKETPSDPAGLAVAQTARALPWAAVMAAEAPDLDVFIRLIPGLGWVGHRGITHTVVAVPFIVLSIALLVKLFFRRTRLAPLLGVTLVALLVAHFFGDIITYRGIRPLLPWSAWRLNWPLLPRFIDLWVTLPFLAAAVGGLVRAGWRRRAGLTALAWLGSYLVFRGWVTYL